MVWHMHVVINNNTYYFHHHHHKHVQVVINSYTTYHHHHSAWKSKAAWPVLDATSVMVREAALRRTVSWRLKRCGHSFSVSALSLSESTRPASREGGE